MGTSLRPIANHQIPFEGKNLAEIIAFVQPKLNALGLHNWAFLCDFAVKWYGSGHNCFTGSKWVPEIEEPQYYDYNTAEYKQIDFNGPYGLNITFDENFIRFWDPPFRYRQWFGLLNADGTEAIEARNEWRRYMKAVTQAFGGSQVIYLADNAHPLDKYLWTDESVAAIEKALKFEFGESATSFREVLEADEDNQTAYFIDYFQDL